MADYTDLLFVEESPLVLPKPDDVTAYADPAPPVLTISPQNGIVAPTATITAEGSDDRLLAILTITQDDRVVYDGFTFTSDYASSEQILITGGKRLLLRRNAGWPSSFTITATALDAGGNVVRITGTYGLAVEASSSATPSARLTQWAPISDVHLRHTDDGGEIDFVGGQAVLSDGLESAVYLSLWGGNERDSGKTSDTALQWWGNLGESDPAYQYRSETQYLLRSLPATPANLRRVEDAAMHDLAWLTGMKIASACSVSVSMPAVNSVQIDITLEIAPNQTPKFQFRRPWGARTS